MECLTKYVWLIKLVVLWLKHVVVNDKGLGKVLIEQNWKKKPTISKNSAKTWEGGLILFDLLEMKFG
jgi:hypothetical protein